MPRVPLYSSVTSTFRSAVPLRTEVQIGTRHQRIEAPLVIQAIVDITGAHEGGDGNVIVSLEPAWLAVQEALTRDPDLLYQLTPRQWEELVAAAYDREGYDEVILTPRSADLGRDVIAIKRGRGSVRIIDQVKAFKPGHLVTANDVRALVGTLSMDLNSSKGVVTTTSAFAPKLLDDKNLAALVPFRLELVDGPALFSHLKALNRSQG